MMTVNRLTGLKITVWAIGIACYATCQLVAQEKVDFDTQIRPILSDRCFACHGPDESQRAADLRLDEQDGALRETEYGGLPFVIKPGDPSSSDLLARMISVDEETRMPPPDSHLKVSPEEIKLIKQWIAEGAPWSEHWAFKPIAKVDPPIDSSNGWARNEIDQFIWESLKREAIIPKPDADKAILARRVYFDLTGLPPSVEQLDKFLNDDADDAYEKMVDQLLSSPAYGERMAVEWLDVARYADTHGYQLDFESNMWPYRDWVIDAFNNNLPFDDFITWQLAGDLLPNPTRDQILATAFNRLHRQTNEGGSVSEEFRLEYVADRVDTFGVAFLGLSVGCARCHDHKFDPISQKEYYQLSAFFDNIDEAGVFAYFTKATPTPALDLPTVDQSDKLKYLKAKIVAAEKDLAQQLADSRDDFQRWRKSDGESLDMDQVLDQGLIGHFDFEKTVEKPISPKADQTGKTAEKPEKAGEKAKPKKVKRETKLFVQNKINPQSDGQVHEKLIFTDGKLGRGLSLSGDNGFTSNVTKDLTRHDPFTFSFWLKTGGDKKRSTILHTTLGATDSGNRGIDLVMIDGKLNATICHFWPGNAIRIRTVDEVPLDRWVHVAFTYDGNSLASGTKLYIDGQRANCETIKDQLTRTIVHLEKDKVGFKEGNVPTHLTVGYRYRDRGFKNGFLDELRVYDRELSSFEISYLCGDTKNIPTGDDPFKLYLTLNEGKITDARKALRDARLEYAALKENVQSVMVMKELSQPRKTFFLNRGAYDAPGVEVSPGAIAKVLPFGDQLPTNRLGLARWLTDRDNPLTARVAVNRIWQIVVGRGLVSTQEDFGSQGSRPRHPELLDYLCNDFVGHGWNVKHLVKQIVMSSTYRQSSKCSPEMLERDPENELLARGPARRLTAEMIRDSALAGSGLLVSKIGGPPVKPYQPPGLWLESMNIKYQRDTDVGSRRRSLYSFWKRTLPPPSMVTFDAAKREVCTARREATSTPLQALVLLNDPQYVEASRAAAQKAMLEHEDREAQLIQLYRSFTSRMPNGRQIALLEKTFNQQQKFFADAPEETKKFLAIGDLRPNQKLNSSDLAAMTVVAQFVLNLDHFIMRR